MFEGFFDIEESQSSSVKMKAPPKSRKSNNNFVGLLNQGSTCYLNSLIQTLFMTPEFRSKLYKLDEEELGYEELLQADKEEEENEKKGEKKKEVNLKEDPSYEPLLNSLKEMGFVEYHIDMAIGMCNTVSNQEEIMSWLFENPLPDNWEEEKLAKEKQKEESKQNENNDNVKRKVKYRRIPIRLQQLFGRLQLSDENAVSSSQLTKSFGWKQDDVRIQHDITELCRILFDALHRSLMGIRGGDIITSIYRGTVVNKIVCLNCGNTTEREEYFQDIVLPVKGEKNILNSLETYVTPNLLSGENKYECSKCFEEGKGKQEAKFGVSFRTLPDNLVFSLMRFGFNWNSGQRYKINSKLEFPLVIDMNEYLEASTHVKHYFINKTNPTLTPANKSENNNGDNKVNEKNDENQKKTKGKKGKKEKVEDIPKFMNSNFDANSQHLYDLLSIVVHSGGAHGGHYYALIRDMIHEDGGELSDENSGKWYEFNDSVVSQVSLDYIAKEYGGGAHCAYMLIYRKRNQKIDKESLLVKVQSTIKEIEENNKLLEDQRKLWKVEKQKMTISVSTIDLFDIVDGKFYEKKDVVQQNQNQIQNENDENFPALPFGDFNGDEEETLLGGFMDEIENNPLASSPSGNEKNDQTLQQVQKPVVQLAITKKMNMKEILLAIIEKFKEQPNSSELKINMEDPTSLRLDRYAISRGGKVIITELSNNFEQTAKQFGINDESTLLLWSGTEIISSRDIQLNIKFYPSNGNANNNNKKRGKQTEEEISIIEPNLFTIIVKDNISVNNLKTALVEFTKLAESDQLICTEDDVGVRWTRDDEKTLSDLNITDNSIITVERKVMTSGKHPRPISIAMKAFDQKEVKVKLEIIDKIASPEVNYSIECNNDLTVEQLKFQILSLVAEKDRYDINNLVLKRELHGAFEANQIILENKRSVMSYGITANDPIVLDYPLEVSSENIIEENESIISLRFYITFSSDTKEEIEKKKNEELHSIQIANINSIKSLKEIMIDYLLTQEQFASIPLCDKQFRVRKVNFMMELKEILQNENDSLKKLEIKDDHVLCLEEGRVPNPAEITVYFQIFRWIEPTFASLLLGDQFANLFSSTEDIPKPFHLYSPTLMRYHQTKTLDNLNDSIYFSDLRVVHLDKTQTVSSLKNLYLTAIHTALADHELFPLFQSIQSIDQIRFWASNKLASSNNSTLKKMNIANGTLITVEFLPDNQTESITPNDNLLFIYEWVLNSDVDNSSSPLEYCSLKRLGEINFSSKNATLEELKTAVQPLVPSIETNSISIAKYFYFQTKWLKLSDQSKGASSATEAVLSENMSKKERKAAISQAKKMKNIDLNLKNLRKNDCKLLSGDILLICDTSNALAVEIFNYWLESDFKNDNRLPKKPPKRSFEQEAERIIYSASVFKNFALEEGGVAINIGDIEGVPDF